MWTYVANNSRKNKYRNCCDGSPLKGKVFRYSESDSACVYQHGKTPSLPYRPPWIITAWPQMQPIPMLMIQHQIRHFITMLMTSIEISTRIIKKIRVIIRRNFIYVGNKTRRYRTTDGWQTVPWKTVPGGKRTWRKLQEMSQLDVSTSVYPTNGIN